MTEFHKLILVLVAAAVLSQGHVYAQSKQRADIVVEYTWRLDDLYASDEAWSQAKSTLAGRLDEILKYKGSLAGSASQLTACLELNSELSKALGRLHCYASMKSDQDIRNSEYLAMKQETEQLATDYSAKASFIKPEIAAMDRAAIDGFIKDNSALAVYRMYLYDILRTKQHRLSEKEEKILAQAGMLADGPESIYSVLSNAELPYPEIKLSDGTTARLDKPGYARCRALPNRADRQAVFEMFWQVFDKFKGTFGAQLYANVKKDLFYARARGYNSCLESALDKDNIPARVYTAIIENADNNLGSFHRYLNLKKRMLGVESLKYCDVYAPVVKGIDLKYGFDEGRRLVLDAFKPLGDDYCRVVENAFENRWIDVYPSPGKRAGAYSNGAAYDVHPYVLLNFNGQYEDVSTLAHELGHAVHSFYSNKKQPYPTADYATFVAEVASTFNEALLIHRMLREVQDAGVRLALMMNYLDGIRQTVFRQAQFAEFELRIHEKAERGEALTGDVLSRIYGDILRKYYGHDKGVCRIDDLYTVEWAYVPHFYYNFYVFQYATSFTAATALSEEILSGRPGAIDRYIEFLCAGGSDYPIELLKKAGVDMTTAEPFNRTMAAMNKVMDELERALDKNTSSRK